MRALVPALALLTFVLAGPAKAELKVNDRYAQNGAVKLHYAAAGSAKAPLVVMLHGFPDYWGTWRPLMDALDDRYRLAALDLRGYNLSDKPAGEAAYAFPNLIGDVEAVIKAEGRTSGIIVGHDWGAAIAWRVAMDRPELVEKLIILSVPHPVGFAREMASNPAQQANSQYARNFQQPGFEKNLTAEGLAAWMQDPALKAPYVEALKRSDFTAMLNYYRANYPRETGGAVAPPPSAPIKAPLLVIHGMKDTALNAAGHNGTWDRAEKDTTILMLPAAAHFVQHDAAALVNRTIRDWLEARR